MENPEEILHSLEEFSKMKPKDIPRELEEYLCFVAKTGNPVYQWPTIKSLFREKLLNVITEFYESCPSVEIPPCPNVEIFNYDIMKNFILEKLDTFASAPFTVQRICELLTTPRKEYNRIDKYMRALEKNILVVTTMEPARRSTENGDGILNGIEAEHLPETSNSSHDINVEEMDESPSWPRTTSLIFETANSESQSTNVQSPEQQILQDSPDEKIGEVSSGSPVATIQEDNSQESISCPIINQPQEPYVSIEPVALNSCTMPQETVDDEIHSSLSITALPAGVQQRRSSMERVDNYEESSVAVQELEKEEQNEPEKEKPLAENTFPNTASPDHEEMSVEKDKHSDNTVTVEGTPTVENISSENFPSLITEKLQVDDDSMYPKVQLASAASLQLENQDKMEEKEANVDVEGDKPEVNVASDELTCVLPSTAFLETNKMEEAISKSPDYPEPNSDTSENSQPDPLELKSYVEETTSSCDSLTNSTELAKEISGEVKVDETACNVSGDVESDSKSETPMEASAFSDVNVEEKRDVPVEEEASTRNDL